MPRPTRKNFRAEYLSNIKRLSMTSAIAAPIPWEGIWIIAIIAVIYISFTIPATIDLALNAREYIQKNGSISRPINSYPSHISTSSSLSLTKWQYSFGNIRLYFLTSFLRL
jgi:hypothetical protein